MTEKIKNVSVLVNETGDCLRKIRQIVHASIWGFDKSNKIGFFNNSLLDDLKLSPLLPSTFRIDFRILSSIFSDSDHYQSDVYNDKLPFSDIISETMEPETLFRFFFLKNEDVSDYNSFLFCIFRDQAPLNAEEINEIKLISYHFLLNLAKFRSDGFDNILSGLAKSKAKQKGLPFLKRNCRELAQCFGADTFSLWIIKGNKLFCKYFSDNKKTLSEIDVYDISKPDGDGITGYSAKTGKSFYLHSVSDARKLYGIEWKGKISDFSWSPPNPNDHMMVIPLKYEVIGEERKKNETVTKGVVRFISAHSHPSFWPIDFKRAYAIANTLSVIFYQEKILDELKTKQESIENLSAKRGELLNFMFQASERTNINEIILDLISLISEWDGVQDIDIIDMANSDQEIDRCLFLDADQKNRLKSFINQERTLDGIFDGDIQAWPVKSKNSLFAIILTQISYNDIKLHEWFQFACLCLASYYSIYQLINERKRLTKEIEENEMETIAGMFARKVGHEVLNAVKSIHSWAKLNQKTSPDFSGLANRVNILSENVDLLIRSSGYNIIRKECVFVKEVEKILKKLRLKNDSMFNDCLIKLSVAGHKHRKIHLDPATLIGIIHNLVLNSSEQYALNQKKGGPIEISIVEKEIDNILNIGLSVKDYALGIPEENLDKIFEENFTTKPSGGKGIGLTIVENLASICDGKIKVETEYGHFADIRVFYRVID